MRAYAANIFSDVDPTQANELQAASLADLATALTLFAETIDLIEQLVQYNPTDIYNWNWISFFLYFHISKIPPNHASNADAIWDPIILKILKTKYPPFHFTQLFAMVTSAINDLRSVEFALRNYDENVSALIGAGVLIQVLRHFECLLSQWTILHSLEYMDRRLLSQDHLLFPKLLRRPAVRPMTQPRGKVIFSHPIYSSLALFLCLVMSTWSLHPLRMAIIFSFSHRSRYTFQRRSPFWIVLEKIPLLLPLPMVHWVLSECSILQILLITVVAGLFATFATRALTRPDLVPAYIKLTIINFLIDRSLYESCFNVYLCTDRSLATQLNMVLIYFFLHELLVCTVDPTGLCRARAYYCGDIPITLQNGDVHSLVQIKRGF